jgi:hypothetical protein
MRAKQTGPVLKKIGDKLTQMRIEKGYPERVAFSRAFELPEIQYWRIEKGRANISINSLVKLLYIHRMPIEEFFKDL